MTGYLGSQLEEFSKKNLQNKLFIKFNRKTKKFDTNKPKSINLIINFSSPNEIVCRSGTDLNSIFKSWKKTVDIAINSTKITHLINISSIHVFKNRNNLINESSKYGSKDPYAVMQMKCVKYLNEKCLNKKIRLINLFVSNIYGSINKNIKIRQNLVLNETIISALLNKNLVLKSDCNVTRDFVWIEDFLIILNKIIEKKDQIKFKKIIVASGQTLNVKKIIIILFNYLKKSKKQKIIFGEKITNKLHPIYYSNLRLLDILNLENKNNFKSINQTLKKLESIYK